MTRPLFALALALALAFPASVGSQQPVPAPVLVPDSISTPAVKPKPKPVPRPKTAEAPKVELPAEVTGNPGEFIPVRSTTNGATVRWYVVTPGLNLFPADMLKDSRSTVVTAASAGRYELIAWTAIGDAPSEAAKCVVVVGVAPEPVPPGPPRPPVPPGPVVPAAGTAATYVYELRDDGAAPIPSAVLAGLNRLNREKKVLATLFEQPPAGSVIPEQYKVAYAAAKAAGLPSLIITKDGAVLSVVKAPTTSEQVFGAVQ